MSVPILHYELGYDNTTVTVTVTSPVWGEQTKILPIKKVDWQNWLLDGRTAHVLDAFPYLTTIDAEFLITGCPSDEAWNAIFPEEEE